MRSVPARAALLGAIFAALVTLPALGAGTLWDNSETAYGEVAREIVLTHDWVVMHLNLQPWFVQPPLYFWIAALFAKVFGVSALALRLPSALATIAMGAAVGYATARIAGGRAGTVAAVVLSTSLMQAIVGRLAIMDALLDFAVAAAILWWFRALQPGGSSRRRATAFIGGALALALGTLAKGPVAPVVVLLVLVVWALWERRSGRITAPSRGAITLALLAYVVVTLPWFVLLAVRVGPHAILELIGHYTVGRYTGVIENQSGPIWYYVPVLILGFFPWIAFLPAAARAAWYEARQPDGAFARLALVWTVVPFLFFSFANTKLPNYVALLIPALAILVALWFERIAAGAERRAAIVSAASIPVFLGCVAIALAIFARTNQLSVDAAAVGAQLAFLGVAMLVGSLVTVVTIARRATVAWSPFVLALTSGALVLFIAIVAEPDAERLKPIPPIARAIDAAVQPGDLIAMRGISGNNGLIFYTRPPALDIPDGDDAFEHAVCSAPTVWAVIQPDDADRLQRDVRAVHRVPTLVARGPLGTTPPRALLLRVTGPRCP